MQPVSARLVLPRSADNSTWMLVTDNAEFIDAAARTPIAQPPGGRAIVWTDACGSLLQVLEGQRESIKIDA